MTIEKAFDLAEVRRARSQEAVAHRRYLRLLLQGSKVSSQTQLARSIGISQPSVNSALKAARAVPDVRPGFSGASPYEIALCFDAGQLSREQAIDELGRWAYAPGSSTDGFDWTTGDQGEFGQVERALSEQLIDAEMYDEILDRYSEQGR